MRLHNKSVKGFELTKGSTFAGSMAPITQNQLNVNDMGLDKLKSGCKSNRMLGIQIREE